MRRALPDESSSKSLRARMRNATARRPMHTRGVQARELLELSPEENWRLDRPPELGTERIPLIERQ